jgi:hypothetical protein
MKQRVLLERIVGLTHNTKFHPHHITEHEHRKKNTSTVLPVPSVADDEEHNKQSEGDCRNQGHLCMRRAARRIVV